jgi:hypothetical protein
VAAEGEVKRSRSTEPTLSAWERWAPAVVAFLAVLLILWTAH